MAIKTHASEQEIQNSMIEFLQYRNYRAFRINSGEIFTKNGGKVKLAPKGTPDIYALKRGRSYWIEVKRPGETSTDIQLMRQEELRSAGAIVFEAHSLEELQEKLTYYEKSESI